jgi:naphthalene 1,2-dioxygenase system ferredoxin subunit
MVEPADPDRDDARWHRLCAREEVPEGDVWAFSVAGRELAVYGIDGQVHASDNLCTHGQSRLSDGFVDGRQIECPLHQGRFDICSGRALCAPLERDLRIYPVEVRGDTVYVRLD